MMKRMNRREWLRGMAASLLVSPLLTLGGTGAGGVFS